MLGSVFDKAAGLFDRRFVLALLVPAFALAAGVGALTATLTGWSHMLAWWQHLDTGRQVLAGLAAATVVVLGAVIAGTQVVAMTRLLEGYWRWPLDRTLGRLGRWREGHRRDKLAGDRSPLGYLRSYLAFAPPESGAVMPTRLGNALRAAEFYPGDGDRWGLDAVYWWPRLYLILPDSAKSEVDDARASLDQLVVLSVLSAAFCVTALGFTCGGLNPAVGLGSAAGALILARVSYLAAVTAATVFGDLVRSCFDLFRNDLLARLGWQMPATLSDERRLWAALGQQFYRRGASREDEALINAPRARPVPPGHRQG